MDCIGVMDCIDAMDWWFERLLISDLKSYLFHQIYIKNIIDLEMEMATFAIENAYAEGIIGGFRSSFFTDQQYTQIKNCSSLD